MSKGYFVDWTKNKPVVYYGKRKYKPVLEGTHTWQPNDGSADALLAKAVLDMDPLTKRFHVGRKQIVFKSQTEMDTDSDTRSDAVFDGPNTMIIKSLIAELAISPPDIDTAQEFEDRVRTTFKALRRMT